MINSDIITISDYLTQKNIEFKEVHGELLTKCLFSSCDDDSRSNERHLYFNKETSQYHCKKCDAKGNILTLAKHLGDDSSNVYKNPLQTKTKVYNKTKLSLPIPDRIRAYLNKRGITDSLITNFGIHYGKFYGKEWIVIPVTDHETGKSFLKLRKDPDDSFNECRYMFHPTGSTATLFGKQFLKEADKVFICEGEFDAMLLSSYGVKAVTSSAGASTFKDEWVPSFRDIREIYMCFDNDVSGQEGAKNVIQKIVSAFPDIRIFNITFPSTMQGKDLTDYFINNGGTLEELFKLAKQVSGKKPIDVSKFSPINSEQLIKVLDLTIKKDNENKLTTFLCMLSAYTEDSQFNISFNAPSSSGKSYIPIQISKLFPRKDVMEIGYCTPTAFFHEVGNYNSENQAIETDLSKKIIVFLDLPSTHLLERLRPLLSHDTKEMTLKITDKSGKGGNKTKTVVIKGFPAVIFCSAGLKIDEQEGTRFLLLSPQIDQEKIREGILERIKKESNSKLYFDWIEKDPERCLLKDRIEAIKDARINDIVIPDANLIEELFLANKKILQARHQRDIGRLIALVKIFALLNLWFRPNNDGILITQKEDIDEAMKVWNVISESQEHNLPPYIYNFYRDIILSAWKDKQENVEEGEKSGLSRQDIQKTHYVVMGKAVPDWQLRQQILPMLESAGLITQEQDFKDKRRVNIFPSQFFKQAVTEGRVIEEVSYDSI